MSDIQWTGDLNDDCTARWGGDEARYLAAENERLRAVVDKLPHYADTGEPFVPGQDPAWVFEGTDTIFMTGDRMWRVCHDEPRYQKFYSTREAAAKENQR